MQISQWQMRSHIWTADIVDARLWACFLREGAISNQAWFAVGYWVSSACVKMVLACQGDAKVLKCIVGSQCQFLVICSRPGRGGGWCLQPPCPKAVQQLPFLAILTPPHARGRDKEAILLKHATIFACTSRASLPLCIHRHSRETEPMLAI